MQSSQHRLRPTPSRRSHRLTADRQGGNRRLVFCGRTAVYVTRGAQPGSHVYRFASFLPDDPCAPDAFLRGRLRSPGMAYSLGGSEHWGLAFVQDVVATRRYDILTCFTSRELIVHLPSQAPMAGRTQRPLAPARAKGPAGVFPPGLGTFSELTR